MTIARRRRLAGWAGALAGSWAEGAFEVGEWDAILALAVDLDGEGLLPADESARAHLRARLDPMPPGGVCPLESGALSSALETPPRI